MTPPTLSHRLVAATGLDRGDREYQQDQVAIFPHPRVEGCLLAVLADGMGGKSGGRKAADQVLLTAAQLFDRHAPDQDDPVVFLQQLVQEAHLMIRLTAVAAEEDPHSTVAAFVIHPDRSAAMAHVGDSRVYHLRGRHVVSRTQDHSCVQRLVDAGTLTEDDARHHPQSNLLTGCLGTPEEPPITTAHIGRLEPGDALLACSDGLWAHFRTQEIATLTHTLFPREAAELLIAKARQRARGGGDNISLALVRLEAER